MNSHYYLLVQLQFRGASVSRIRCAHRKDLMWTMRKCQTLSHRTWAGLLQRFDGIDKTTDILSLLQTSSSLHLFTYTGRNQVDHNGPLVRNLKAQDSSFMFDGLDAGILGGKKDTKKCEEIYVQIQFVYA